MKWLTILRALPVLIQVARQMSKTAERRALAERALAAFGDGSITRPEWAGLGEMLGLFRRY